MASVVPVYRVGSFETWWAYRTESGPLAALGDWGSHLHGDVFRFLPPQAKGEGPLVEGFCRLDGTYRIDKVGAALDVPDARLRRLILSCSTLTLEVGQKAMSQHEGVPFRLLFGENVHGSGCAADTPIAAFPGLVPHAWSLQRRVAVPPRQGMYMRWRATAPLRDALRENEQTAQVPITVVVYIRGQGRVPRP
jgi:hypothetical protein